MMKRIPKMNKLLALVLALILFTSSSVGVYAEDENKIVAAESSQSSDEEEVNKDSSDKSQEESLITTETSNDDESSGDTKESDSKDDTSDSSSGDESEKSDDADSEGTEDSSEEDDSDENDKDDSEKKDSEDTTLEDETSSEEDEDAETEEGAKPKKAGAKASAKAKHSDEHELDYVDLGNGKHKVTCKEDDDFESYEEECTYDNNGHCERCGAYDETKDVNKKKNAKITRTAEINGITIEAEFTGNTFDAEDVNIEVSAAPESVKELVEIYISSLAFICNSKTDGIDITFKSGDNAVQPKSGEKVKITVKGLSYVPKAIAHHKGNEDFDLVNFEKNEDGSISFSSSGFSPFLFVTYDEKTMDNLLSDGRIYGCPKDSIGSEGAPAQSPYGYATTTENHLEGIFAKDKIDEGYYALRMMSHNSDDNNYVVIAPYEGTRERYYAYEPVENGQFKISIEAPENYYIESVYLKGSNSKFYQDGGSDFKTKLEELPITLNKMNADKTSVNDLVVCLKQIPVKMNGEESTIIKGAKIINYKDSETVNDKNYLRAFGSTFQFNHGDESGSNKCNYRQVYQGLGADTFDISKGFKLASDNKVELFPKSGEHDYIVSNNGYRENVGVLFKKDTDGYWTIDSDYSRYEIVTEKGQDILKPVSGSKSFRPFGGNVCHFGMELPITFSVSNGGKDENGKDTIFKFAGDDDVFVYIDGKLVLDLGGVHDAIKGQINFNTGEVLIQGDYQSRLTSSIDNTCFARQGIGAKNIYSIFDKSGFMNKEHDLTVVYFERGANRSNCRISFNFNKAEQVDTEFKGFKRKSDGQTPVSGAEFTLYTDAECKNIAKIGVSDAVTKSDAEGTILFKGLPVGIITNNSTAPVVKTYYMKETKAAEGYVTPANAIWKLVVKAQKEDSVINTSYTLTAESDEAKSLSLKTSDTVESVGAIKNDDVKIITGDYQGLKVDSKDKTKGLKGAEFTLYKKYENGECKEEIKKVTTDSNGKFEFKNLEIGVFTSTAQEKVEKTYYLKETKAPTGYFLRENAVWKLDLKATQGESKVTAKLTAITDDANANSVVSDGIVKTIINDTARKVTGDYQGLKVDSKDNTKALKGAEFTLYKKYEDGTCKEEIKKVTTDNNGNFEFKNIEVGEFTSASQENVEKTYYLKETKAPAGYFLRENAVWKIVFEATQDDAKAVGALTAITDDAKANSIVKEQVVTSITNDPAEAVTGDYEGLKVDSKDNTKALKDAEFTLYSDEACKEEIKKVTTDKDGKFKFTELNVGEFTSTSQEKVEKTYYLKETKAPKGYSLPENAVWKLTLTANKGDEKATGKLTAITKDAVEYSIVVDSEVKSITNEKKNPGKLKITKAVKNFYKPGGTGACVFQVDYTVDDKPYSYVYSLDFSKAGVKSLAEIEIPADTEVTVTEKYSGACYSIVGSDKQTVTIEENKTSEVEFVNDYDGRKNVGGISVKNIFTKTREMTYEFLKMVMGGEQ